MRPVVRPWTAEESLGDLTLHLDWDSIAAMIQSLRVHLFEHGTIPVWNFMFCGGRPELSAPYSWAYTWPSLFAYSLPPVYAILAVWGVLTVAGFASMRALLVRWTGSSLGASVGATVYAFSGYYASHFNVGHVTFAFFHLVPILMLLFEVGFEGSLVGRARLGPALLTTGVAFLAFSGGLPHLAFHAYPAVVLLIVVRVGFAARDWGWGRSLRAGAAWLGFQALGVWLAAYKLWPVIRWQLLYPRRSKAVELESYELPEVLLNTLLPVPDYFADAAGKIWHQPWHVYPPWAYNAFVGPLPWILALGIGLRCLRGRSARGAPTGPFLRVACFAIALTAIGTNLCLGNDHPLGLGRFFLHLPVLDGVRLFNRNAVLLVMGLGILSAQAIASLARAGRAGPGLAWLLAFGCVAPVVLQASLLVWNVRAFPDTELLSRYRFAPNPAVPRHAGVYVQPGLFEGHESSLLERGYWIGNCYHALTLPGGIATVAGAATPLAEPAPRKLVRLTRDSLTLAFGPGKARAIRLNLRVLPGFRFDPPPFRARPKHPIFAANSLPEGRLTIAARYPGPAEGVWMSAAGALVAGVVFVGFVRRR